MVKGDVTCDGIDNVVVADGTNGVSVWARTSTSFTFQQIMVLPGAGTATGVAIADFDQDGKPDIAVTEFGAGQVRIWRGQCAQTIPWNSSTTWSVDPASIGQPKALGVGDFDKSGSPDLAFIGDGNGQRMTIVKNNCGAFCAAMNFAAPQAFAVSSTVQTGIVVADFSGDGWVDVALTESNPNQVEFMINDLPFAGPIVVATSQTATATLPTAAAAGVFRVTGNGLAVVRQGNPANQPGTLEIYRYNGGVFVLEHSYSVGVLPSAVFVADYNQDLSSDVAVANSGSDNLSVYLGSANYVFHGPTTASLSPGSVGPVSLVAADFHLDGMPMFFTSNQSSGDLNAILNTTTPAPQIAVHSSPVQIVFGDLGSAPSTLPDLVVADSGGNDIAIAVNQGNGIFAAPVFVNVGGAPLGVALADIDQDGFLDAAVTLRNTGFQLLLNDQTGHLTIVGPPAVLAAPKGLVAGDFDADGKMDFAVADGGAGQLQIFYNLGFGGFAAPVNVVGFPNAYALVAGDFNKDGKIDLAVTSFQNAGKVYIATGNGGRGNPFTVGLPIAVFQNPDSITVGDYDGDGNPDLVIASATTPTRPGVLWGLGNGNFNVGLGLGTMWALGVASGDINGDGRVDLIGAADPFGLNGTVNLITGAPVQADFEDSASQWTFGLGPDLVNGKALNLGAIDLDGDAKLDAAVVSQAAGKVSLLFNGCQIKF